MKKIILLLGIILVFISCEKTVENFEIERKPTKIVLNAQFISDSSAIVNVSKSLSMYDDDSIYAIDDADVIVTENNGKINKFNAIGEGYYSLNGFIPKANSTYKIEVSATGFDPVFTIITTPDKPAVLSIDTALVKINTENCIGCENRYIEIKVKFSDNGVSEDYYMVCIKGWYKEFVFEEKEVNDPYWGKYIDYIMTDSSYYIKDQHMEAKVNYIEFSRDYSYLNDVSSTSSAYGNVFYFSDNLINGNELFLPLYIQPFEIALDTTPELMLYFSKISKDHYLYISSLAKSNETEGNPLTEKVTIFNNIEGGLGHSMGMSTNIQKIDISGLVEQFYNYYYW
ncbi:MAG: DUF4249 domain-containing protein [Bacteroidales bacterium]|nr:DUF4249 domain-containing protein [Bacteroidales bacterium]